MTCWCDERAEGRIGGGVPRRVLDRLSKIIPGATLEHSEPLQLLRYEDGQRYGEHHDFIEGQELLPCGPRVFTLLLYLSDVEEGGETRFAETRAEEESRVIVDVEPKKGRAVLWPSVTSDDPNVKDERTATRLYPSREAPSTQRTFGCIFSILSHRMRWGARVDECLEATPGW